MSLTWAQIEARRGKLTASRVAVLMNGTREAVHRLWQEYLEIVPPADLSDNWAVRLGEATEPLNLEWYQRKSGAVLSRKGEVAVHPTYEWAAATLDAWDDVLCCPVECKHVGGREPLEVVIERYQPQLQWQMEVTGATQCALSIIVAASPPVVEYIEQDAVYARLMLDRGYQFMQHVWTRTEPVVLDPVPPPIDAQAVYDFSGNNQWADQAWTWLQTHGSFERCRDAEKVIKSLVPADARKAFGHGVRVTRDRAGRLSLREDAT
jgi:predicted phage-related endonuclease